MGKLCCSFSPRPFVAGLRLPENLGSCLNAASQSACAGNPEPAGPADQREDNPRFRKEEGRSEVAVGPIWVRQWKNPAQKAAQCAGRWKGNVQLGRGGRITPLAVLQLGPAPLSALPVPRQLPVLLLGRVVSASAGDMGAPCPQGFSHAGATGRYPHMGEKRAWVGANRLQPCAELPATGMAPWPSPPALRHP